MANNQTNEQAASDDKRRLAEFFHALVDKDKPLTEIPWNNLGKEETMEFLIERIKKGDKAEIAKVVENIGHFSHQLQEQKYRVLAAAVSKGYPSEDIPLAEYVAGVDSDEGKVLLNAIVKQDRGAQFLIALGEFAISDNVPAANLKAAYNYVAGRLNGGRLRQLLSGKQIDRTYDEVVSSAAHSAKARRAADKYYSYWTEQLKTKGVEALQLFNESTEAAIEAYEAARRNLPYGRLNEIDIEVSIRTRPPIGMRHNPEFTKALKAAFEAQVEMGAEGTLKSARIAKMLYSVGYDAGHATKEEPLCDTVRNAVKKHPKLLKAMDEFLEYGQQDDAYLDLANAAVTGANFDWNDLNLNKLSVKLQVGYNDVPDWRINAEIYLLGFPRILLGREDDAFAHKWLDFKEKMTLLVSNAKEAAKTDDRVKMPEEFEVYVSGGKREKLAKKINKLRNKKRPYFAKFVTNPVSKHGTLDVGFYF